MDHLGRSYVINHETHTVQYESPSIEGSDNVPGSQGRREMLNRRYESLQRSFRSAHHQRRIQTSNNLSPGESAGAISYLPGNRRESDELATPAPVASNRGGSSKKEQKKSRWFSLGRKNRSISQSAPDPQDSNIIPIDILSPITPPPSLDDLGISLPPFSNSQTTPISNGELEREPDLGDHGTRPESSQHRSENNRNSVLAILDAMSSSEPHPSSNTQPRPKSTDQPPHPQTTTPEVDEEEPPLSPTHHRATDLDTMRQVQKKISLSRISRRSQQDDGGDTDEETDVRPSPSASVEPTEVTSTGEGGSSEGGDTPGKEEGDETDDQQQQFTRQRSSGSKRKLSKGLTESPALKFITRPDLYTFLNSCGVRNSDLQYTCTPYLLIYWYST